MRLHENGSGENEPALLPETAEELAFVCGRSIANRMHKAQYDPSTHQADIMAKRSVISKAADAVRSAAETAAAAVIATRSAGKPSLAELGVPMPRTKIRTKKKAATKTAARKKSRKTRL